MKPDLALQLGAAVLLVAFGLAGGLAPWWARQRALGDRLLGLGSAFAGGVLLGAGLIHLLGDAQEGFARLWPADDYPWALLIACASFLGVLCLERVAPRVARVPVGSGPTEEADQVLEALEESASYPYLLLVTLSVHSLLAGFALGTQGTTSGFAVVLLAVLAHKSAAGFALGESLHRAGLERGRALRLVLGFAVMTPLGLLAGAGVSALLEARASQVAEAIFDAVAAGTFLYIATLDVLREEFLPPPPDRLGKWIGAVAGLALMAALAVWI